jgi:hypothetical protein
MAVVTFFPVPPSRLRAVEPQEGGIVIPFPRHASQRRVDQLLREHVRSVLEERRERDRTWDWDADPRRDW